MAERSIGLQAWIDRLNQAELPALAAVVQDLHRLSQADRASVQQLADVLLRDASLTSKVLRVGNSAYYNPSQESIRTISRAIVLIGFDNVRLIGMSVCLIDSLLAKAPREQLQMLLARSFHAAVQARNIAGYVLSRSEEEVFIAALLHTVGELAFWASGGAQADELAVALERPGMDPDEAVREVLGTSFRQLTQGLVRSWNLGELAAFAHGGGNQHDPAVRAIGLGVKISEAALEGWDSPEMEQLVQQVAEFTGVSPEDALRQVLESARETVEVATTFGAGQLCRLIPDTDPEQIRLQQQERKARLLQPDQLVLQQALQDLGMMVSSKADVGMILDTLLKGLHRGAGLERVMLAVLADGQTRFRVKRAIGEGTERWLSDFQLPASQIEQPHIFSYVLRNREALWMGVPASYNLAELVTLPMRQQLGQGMFFIAPLLAGSREIGVLYADCRVSGRALKHEQFVAFQRFAQLTVRCLEALGKR
ncbi:MULTISPECIES: HDOD domain-containing protein [unclassified Pseudomonas]|uniref:HDOD domain-containing protein n=1 Tax=unclassified Pseudomonas TaxID=196821 RepID=UPI00244BDB44|nr:MULTISPECIES: HDOD domain-containing protein [unclassified Pseudomonas]MDG9926830.1 HDOD domain-containing protein [Pseudomonas sp. GD04042]MDH0484364.1 HDOD domain-containing protein [Pseudomonas sp. GD04015]MDH0606612.1 HDOD domain-containing protein [Pseudomonas sp. GD03869]